MAPNKGRIEDRKGVRALKTSLFLTLLGIHAILTHPRCALNDLGVHCIILFSSLHKQIKYPGNVSTWASSFRWTNTSGSSTLMAAPRVGFLELLLHGPESESSRTLETERQFEKIRGFIKWTCRVGPKDCRPGVGL